MSVGDVSSSERGSGARFNDGKVELHQVPMWVLRDVRCAGALAVCHPWSVVDVIVLLGDWQRGKDYALEEATAGLMDLIDSRRPHGEGDGAIDERMPVYVLDGVARVLMYGAKKYARGNWAKGMSWSIVLDCALRHLLADVEAAGSCDRESGLPHLDHALCNLLFLLAYRDLYPEGDDRITEFRGFSAARA